MKTALVLQAVVLCALAAASHGYSYGGSSGCDTCQGGSLPVVKPRFIKPAPVAYRTVYQQVEAPAEEVQQPCGCQRTVRVPAPTYTSTGCAQEVAKPACRTYSSSKTKNVVEVVKTYEPRYHLRSRPVKVHTTCTTCEQPMSSCGCGSGYDRR